MNPSFLNPSFIEAYGELEVVRFPHLCNYLPIVEHCFTTRKGGVSTGCYSSMNVSPGCGDSMDNVTENHGILERVLGFNMKNLVWSKQVHLDNILVVDSENRNQVCGPDKGLSGFDGFITDLPDVPLMTTHADCIPVFLFDPARRAIGVVHSGWRGTVLNIAVKAVRKMAECYGCRPEDLLVGIGPGIGICCFEVDQPVVDEFEKAFSEGVMSRFVRTGGNGKFYISLQGVIKEMLLREGVSSQNIYVSQFCTKCNPDLFFSHRVHQGKRGAMGAIIQLRAGSVIPC